MTHADQADDASDGVPFRPVVIAPTYNNAATLLSVLERIERVGVPLIVINDGATDDTAGVLDAWSSQTHPVVVHVLTHAENRGKAAAMRTGFAQARLSGYSHAVTMDTDGQLSPEEIPAMLDAARAVPDALVLGRRSEHTPGLPKSNLTGWYTSSLGLWLETGVVVRDSQCGLRVYPLRLFDAIRCRTGRFGFEAEIIARAVWAGCPIVEVPVSCIYPPRGERVSHLKPFRDGAKGFFMHWALAIRRLIPWPQPKLVDVEGTADAAGNSPPYKTGEPHRVNHPRVPHRFSGGGRAKTVRGWASWHHWVSPLALWRQVRSSRLEQLCASAAVGHGAFMACLPLGSWIVIVVAYGSKRLHHNLFAAMLGAALVIPPIGVVVAKASITIGYALTHFGLPDFSGATPGVEGLGTVFTAFPLSRLVGGVLLGTVLHWLAIVLLFSVLRFVPTVEGPMDVGAGTGR